MEEHKKELELETDELTGKVKEIIETKDGKYIIQESKISLVAILTVLLTLFASAVLYFVFKVDELNGAGGIGIIAILILSSAMELEKKKINKWQLQYYKIVKLLSKLTKWAVIVIIVLLLFSWVSSIHISSETIIIILLLMIFTRLGELRK